MYSSNTYILPDLYEKLFSYIWSCILNWFMFDMNLLCLTAYLHCTPFFSLQLAVQQGSSLRWRSPGSHSSPSSTRELPHKFLVRTLKHCGALTFRVRLTEALLQLENRWNKQRCKDTNYGMPELWSINFNKEMALNFWEYLINTVTSRWKYGDVWMLNCLWC